MILVLPMKLPSVANQRIHWATKARQVKAQRNAVAMAWLVHADRVAWVLRFAGFLRGPGIEVTLTRQGPRALDSDNLASAFKAIRDEVALKLGVNDNDPRVTWSYGQGKGPAKVVVGIWARASVAARMDETLAKVNG